MVLALPEELLMPVPVTRGGAVTEADWVMSSLMMEPCSSRTL